MNENRFATVTRSLTSVPSRRDVLRGLASAALGLGVARFPATAEARKKRKKKPKKPKPNEYGCLSVGVACSNAGQCCSGICEGRKGKQRCKAHDVGTCAPGGTPAECGGADVACTTSLGKPGTCATTTGNAPYCVAEGACRACKTDADCRAAVSGSLAPRAACIRCADCPGSDGTACVIPDTVEPDPI